MVDVDAWQEEDGALRALARHLVRDEHEADDVVQETWLAALRARVSPTAAWLRGVTRNQAARARARHGRRQQVHALAEGSSEAELDDAARAQLREIQRLLRELVDELPEPYRAVVRGRYFEGLTSAMLAERTGCSAATVRSQLKRGLERLRGRLDERYPDRSVWTSLWIAALGLPEPTSPPLEGPTAQAATGESLRSAVRAFVVLVGLVGVVASVLVLSGRDDVRADDGARAGRVADLDASRSAAEVAREDDQRTAANVVPASAGPEPAAVVEPRVVDFGSVTVTVVDAAGGPLEGATVVSGFGEKPRFEGLTDAEGTYVVRLRDEAHEALEGRGNWLGNFAVSVHMDGYQHSGTYFLTAGSTETPPPSSLEVVMHAPGHVFRGRIVDPDGVGVAGAEITLDGYHGRAPPLLDGYRLAPYCPEVTSEEDGTFELRDLAPGWMRLFVEHPQYVSRYMSYGPGDWPERTNTIHLGRGATITGTVVDEAGVPVAGARVRAWLFEASARPVLADDSGRFELRGVRTNKRVRVYARSSEGPPALASETFEPKATDDEIEWTAVLRPTPPIQFEVVRADGSVVGPAWRVQLATPEVEWAVPLTTDLEGRTPELFEYPHAALDVLIFAPDSTIPFPVDVQHQWQPTGGLTRLELPAPAKPAEISGCLLDAGGVPFYQAHVVLSQLSTGLTVTMDPEAGTGEFVFEDLPSGEFMLAISVPGGIAEWGRVTVDANDRKDLGRVLAPESGWLTVESSALPEAVASQVRFGWPMPNGLRYQVVWRANEIPRNLPLLAGPYQLELRRADGSIERLSFEIAPGATTRISELVH